MKKPIIVIGCGGHAKVLLDTLMLQKRNVIGITAPKSTVLTQFQGVPIIGNDSEIYHYNNNEVELVLGIGSVGKDNKRERIYSDFISMGYQFATTIHPSAIIATDVVIYQGIQIMAGTVIQPGCEIGENTIVNTRSSIDHDCIIGAHCHISPGTILSGSVNIGNNVHIGTGTTVIQEINIGDNSLIGAGSVVVKDVRINSKVMGVPAKEVRI